MKVRFDATLEDLVDVAVRSSPLTQDYYLRLVLSVLSNAFICAIVIQYFWENWYVSILFSLASVGYTLFNIYKIRERRARNLYREVYRIKEPTPIEVETTAAGLSFKQLGITSVYDWNTVRVDDETANAIYFRVGLVSICAIRKRAFASEEEKNQFLELVNRYWSETTTPGSFGSDSQPAEI